MIDRCYSPKDISYKHYGAKGVTVCKEWLDDRVAFITWGEANGYAEGLVLDKDYLSAKLDVSPAMYSPDTCQFVTRSQNESYKATN